MRVIIVITALSTILSAQPKQILRPQGEKLYATVPLTGTGKWNGGVELFALGAEYLLGFRG